jgi:hypothetical protein
MRSLISTALAFGACLFSASAAWAWGCTGHEVVALIALQNLKPDVASQVESILATQRHGYSGRYCSDLSLDPIAYYATWADDYRAGHPATGAWHYWDIPLKLDSATADQFCDQGCVTKALQDQLAILKDTSQDPAKRADALKFVIHFTGDLHQPLHVEDNNERGGNCVPSGFLKNKTKQTDKSTGAYAPNLHGLWDTEIVEYIGNAHPRAKDAVQGFANSLATDQKSVIQKAAKEQVDFVAWALESHAIAQKDPYINLPAKIPVAQTVAPVTECSDNNTSETLAKKHETIQNSYIDAVSPDIQLQLAKAGGRLTAVLNSALGTSQ